MRQFLVLMTVIFPLRLLVFVSFFVIRNNGRAKFFFAYYRLY